AAVSSSLHDLGVHTTDFINEPSVASDGTNVLETWNWNSGISTDGGSTWTYYDPVTLFPKANGGWCCDSHTIYASSQNIFIWNLQYVQDANGNTYRLAVANGGSDLSSATFHYWDLTPQQTNGGTGDWYDFPN